MQHQSFVEELLSVKFISPEIIKPTEEFRKDRVDELAENIILEETWTTPILVEKHNLVIMDGHHRYQVALMLELDMIPCLMIGYDNPYLKLSSRTIGEEITFEKIILAGLTGQLLSYKSTKHDLLIDLLKIKIPVGILKNGNKLQ